MLDLFSSNTKTVFDNEELRHELEEGQREIVYLLGEAIERKSQETGNHIRRVAEITRILALELGYNITESEKIKSASPLHDLGKIVDGMFSYVDKVYFMNTITISDVSPTKRLRHPTEYVWCQGGINSKAVLFHVEE